MEYRWILYQGENEKFPYRLIIKKGEKEIFDLRTREKWPGVKGNIFCLRTNNESNPNENFTEIENIKILSINKLGKKIIIVLDRLHNKRCEFLFIKKKYKNKEGEYEQIFWKTQQNLSQKGKNFKLYIPKTLKKLKVLIDRNEKYAWNFPCESEISELPVGDYALKVNDKVIAVLERKTFKNFIHELGNLPVIIQKLTELAKYKYSALVIEANYSDFLKNTEFYSANFFSKTIANLQAALPTLPIIFAGSRKLAQNWAFNYFLYVYQIEKDESLFEDFEETKLKNLDVDLENKIMNINLNEFTLKDLKSYFPNYSNVYIKNNLENLVRKGKLSVEKVKNRKVWKKV